MNIYSTQEFERATLQQLEKINKGFVKAAYKIKEVAQSVFVNNGKYTKLSPLKGGIMLGKFEDSQVKLHAFGYNDKEKQTYKARFFVGGTKDREYRKATYKKKGKVNLYKPHTTGNIQALDSINKTTAKGQTILDNYIKQALEQ